MLLQRQAHKTYGGTFGLPAGKVEVGETTREAIVREIQEETGISVLKKDLEFIDSVFVRDSGHDLMYHMFRINFVSQPHVQVRAEEHQSYVWVLPTEALRINLIHDQDECIRMCFKEGAV